MLALIVVLEWAMVSLVLGVTTISVPTKRTCGDLILTCTFTAPYDSTETRIWEDRTDILVSTATLTSGTKYVETLPTDTDTSATNFTLTINNFGLADVDGYRCTYGGTGASSFIDIPYTCYDLTPEAVCTTNEITITVDQVYPDLSTTTLNVTVDDSDGTAVPGAITNTSSTTYPNHFTLTWTSDNTVADDAYTYSVGIATISGVAETSIATGANVTCGTTTTAITTTTTTPTTTTTTTTITAAPTTSAPTTTEAPTTSTAPTTTEAPTPTDALIISLSCIGGIFLIAIVCTILVMYYRATHRRSHRPPAGSHHKQRSRASDYPQRSRWNDYTQRSHGNGYAQKQMIRVDNFNNPMFIPEYKVPRDPMHRVATMDGYVFYNGPNRSHRPYVHSLTAPVVRRQGEHPLRMATPMYSSPGMVWGEHDIRATNVDYTWPSP